MEKLAGRVHLRNAPSQKSHSTAPWSDRPTGAPVTGLARLHGPVTNCNANHTRRLADLRRSRIPPAEMAFRSPRVDQATPSNQDAAEQVYSTNFRHHTLLACRSFSSYNQRCRG